MVEETTKAWCAKRGHPFVTYNPWRDDTWCRCGERRVPGDQPQDEQAKWDLFHDHPVDERCRCYLPNHAR